MSAIASRVACLLPALVAQAQGPLDVLRHEVPGAALERWRAIGEGRPALRGFRIVGQAVAPAPAAIDLPAAGPVREAARIVGERLAKDGILFTTALAIEAIGPERFAGGGGEDLLESVGLPVDWLAHFTPPDGSTGTSPVVALVAQELSAGKPAADLATMLAAIPFAFRPSCAGFEVATESGEHEIGLVRLQLTSGTYWAGAGDGGCLDVARQLLEALPEADFVASVEKKHLAGLLETAAGWAIGRPGRLTLVAEPFPVSQWAQDDGKPGLAPSADGLRREVVTLLPRYPSRGEDGAFFLPGEAFATAGFAAAGHRVVRSPLLFQGGDLLAVRDPKTGQRSLLVGEAELWRNTALGLSRQQVLDAFRAELGVDRCIVLPAVSFHVDYEVTVRAVGERLVAFVSDPEPAVRLVLACAADALERGGLLDARTAGELRAGLEQGRFDAFVARVGPLLQERAVGFGHFPESLARFFEKGPTDNGVGNLHRVLLAMDLATAWSAPPEALGPGLDPHSAAYLRSFRRRDAERAGVVADLERLGFGIARVPSLAEGDRSIGYLNGVQARGLYLMPAWGGLFEPLDRAAESAFRRALGDEVRVVAVRAAESQRRGGAVHCSASACPKP